MPHICSQCGACFKDASGLGEGCPKCGCGRFVYVSSQKQTGKEETKKSKEPLENSKKQESSLRKHKNDEESPESIRIIEPGRYDLNLMRLADSDDRVIKVGEEETYRLDLHSMMRKKKKR